MLNNHHTLEAGKHFSSDAQVSPDCVTPATLGSGCGWASIERTFKEGEWFLVSDWNKEIVEEFRGNKGIVGGRFEGKPVLLMTTTGAKSGQHRINPAMYLGEGERIMVFATKGGAPTNPDWYHNLVANPLVTVEVGEETFEATAAILAGEERDRVYARQAELYPQFKEYEEKTTRTIPVVELTRQS